MLKAEKRHTAACKVSEYDRNHTKCKCSYRAVGMLNGVFVRKALKTSNYDQAQKIIRGMEATGAPEQRREAVKIEDAVASFMRDIAARSWQESTQRKFRTLLVDRLRFYASSKGYRFLNQMTLDVVTEFRATWKDAPLTAQKNIERLRMKCGCRIEGPAAEQGVLGRNNARLSRRRAALVTTRFFLQRRPLSPR